MEIIMEEMERLTEKDLEYFRKREAEGKAVIIEIEEEDIYVLNQELER